jgi:hypothetical protein
VVLTDLKRTLVAKPIAPVLLTYVEGLKTHDIGKIAGTAAEDLKFISATRILDKQQALKMLTALYTGFPDWSYAYDKIEDRGQGNYAIKWDQGGTHTGIWAMPGMAPIAPTGKKVRIAPHYFYYRVADDKLTLIFPEPCIGGAPRGILEQIGVELPPL